MQTPPGPKGFPIIGVIPSLIKHGAEYLKATFEQYGDVAELKLLGPLRMYLISHPDHIKQVLQADNRRYVVKRPSMHLTALMGDGLTLSNGELWHRQRRLMQPAFQRQRVEAMTAATVREVARMLDRWQQQSLRQIDLAREMEKLSMGIMLGTLFSSSVSEEEANRIAQAIELVLSVAGRGMFLEIPPVIPTPENLRVKRARAALNRVILKLIEERRDDGCRQYEDLLSRLLEARDEQSQRGMSERQIRDEITAVFVAGYETTAVAMTWMFYLISQHPEVEGHLRQEVDAALSDSAPTAVCLSGLDYMNRVINESLRLWPPFWAMTREAVSEDNIGGYRIPAGSLIVVSPYVTQRHPAFWDEPEKFDPERFRPERSAGRHRFAYFPFGAGPRVCIGLPNAMLTLQTCLAMLTQRYHLELVPDHPIRVHTAMTMRPKYGMLMSLKPR